MLDHSLLDWLLKPSEGKIKQLEEITKSHVFITSFMSHISITLSIGYILVL